MPVDRAMTKEDLAAMLDGRTIGHEITREEAMDASAAGLVVVFGASDDLMEFRGAFHDEVGAGNCRQVRVDRHGILNGCALDDQDDDMVDDFVRRKKSARTIMSLWCAEEDGPAWTYRTHIRHSTFRIYEYGQVWCVGIVFALADLEVAS